MLCAQEKEKFFLHAISNEIKMKKKLLRVFASASYMSIYFKIRDRIQFESFLDSFNTNIINKYARKQIN